LPPSNFNSIYVSPIRCRVTATNVGGSTEAFSNTATVSTPAATVPGTVNSLTATSSLSGTNLNWSASWSAPSSDGGSAITGYRIYVQRAGSSTGPWLATTTQSPAGTGAFTQASPRLVSSATTSVSGRVTGTSATWIRVWVAAVNSVGTGTYTDGIG
jgi:titin